MNIALLTAAGTGTRTHQDIPKQFIHVNNKPIIIYTMDAFQKHPDVDAICVVILNGWNEILHAYAKQFNISKLKYVVNGGKTNHESIYNGLKAISQDCSEDDVIIIHDGNRAMVGQDLITDSLVTYRKNGSAVAAVPCTEVVFTSNDGHRAETSLPREKLWRTQTPHVYRLGDLLSAHEKYLSDEEKKEIPATCSLMEMYGKTSFFSKGSEKNIKITTTDDLEIFEALLHENKERWLK